MERVRRTPHNKAIGFIKGESIESLSFQDYKRKIEELTLAIIKIGIKEQDKICILSNTRAEWNFWDLSVMCSGGVTVPIYHTYNSHEVEYIINHSEAKLVVVEDLNQFKKIIKNIKHLPHLEFIISIEKLDSGVTSKIPSHIKFHQYEDFYKIGISELIENPDLFEIRIKSLHDNNIATIIYTSGTTGKPKGALITQGAFVKMLSNIKKFSNDSLSSSDRSLTFLPLSHVLGRCDSLLNITFGSQSVYAESIDKILNNMQLVQPTFMIAVPRIFEKIFERVQRDLDDSSFIKKSLFNWAMDVCNHYFENIQNDQTPSSKNIFQYQIARKLVTDKIYNKFGGKIRYFLSGGAPLSSEIIRFLRNSNLTLIEGYGLTETIAPCVLNTFGKQKIGTVGKPIGDVEIKFAKDGEILIRTKAMLTGYYKNLEETKKSIDVDGWFYSGDIGVFDDEGYLKITDRKKDIIITSGGKNIAPQKIEGMFKQHLPIEHCILIGDKKKYLTALISISDNFKNDLKTTEIIEEVVNTVNLKLPQFEKIKKFKILPVKISTDNYLTPSLKLKKKAIQNDYIELINSMYED